MSLFSANSDGSSTPTHTVVYSTCGDLSTRTQDQTRTKSKNWLVLYFNLVGNYGSNEESVLCLVDPNEPTPVAADKLEKLVIKVLWPDPKPYSYSISYVSLPKTAERPKPFKATLEHLVEHLREFDISPSSNPGTPNLWGSGANSLEVHWCYKY